MGRPKGTPNYYSQRSTRKLLQLGFDPIEKMVELYHKLAKEISVMEQIRDGTYITLHDTNFPVKYSGVAYTNLMTTQQKIVNDLMRYGYARVPETVNVETPATQPLIINMTPKGVEYRDVADIDVNERAVIRMERGEESFFNNDE
jgi:hypothetical protein